MNLLKLKLFKKMGTLQNLYIVVTSAHHCIAPRIVPEIKNKVVMNRVTCTC